LYPLIIYLGYVGGPGTTNVVAIFDNYMSQTNTGAKAPWCQITAADFSIDDYQCAQIKFFHDCIGIKWERWNFKNQLSMTIIKREIEHFGHVANFTAAMAADATLDHSRLFVVQ
jgi:hypothetical protein